MRKHCDYALTYDSEAARIAKEELGYEQAEKLLLTADDSLYHPMPIRKDIDVCFIGSLTGGPNHRSRARMCQIVQSMPNVKTLFASDVYDIRAIVVAYNRSRIVLNHATDVGQEFGTGYGLQCRHFEAGFTAASVLSNELLGDGDDLKQFTRFNDEESLRARVRDLLSISDSTCSSLGYEMYEELKEGHTPQHRARQLIEFIDKI
jgi:hypothetical protein